MERDFATIFDHLGKVTETLQERRDYTSEGGDGCLDEYRVAIKALRKAEAMINECHLLEADNVRKVF